MTKDEALTMIIASIAMEELALSHIVNAEGEKLQYILGTLPGGPKICADPQEVLAVNKSVTDLLNAVMQNQMLLKGKLETALEAGGRPPVPKPPCPNEPAHPCRPSCGCGLCSEKSALQLVSRCKCFSWDDGFPLPWKCQGRKGCGIRWNEENPALVGLTPGKTYGLNYTVNVRGPYQGDKEGAVCVKFAPCGAFSDVLPLYFSVKGLGCEPLTLHCSALLFPKAHLLPSADFSLLLNYRGSLSVEQASLDVYEV